MKPDKEKQKIEKDLRRLAEDSDDDLLGDEVLSYLDKHDENARVKKEADSSKGGWTAIAVLVAIPLLLVKVFD